MSIKPTGVPPQWAYGPSGVITEPTTLQKDTGWGSAQKPSAGYFNWLEQTTQDYLRYLSYDWVINDDFVTAPNNAGVGNTGFSRQWMPGAGNSGTGSVAGVSIQIEPAGVTGVPGVGIAHFSVLGSAYSELLANADKLLSGSSDFLFEARLRISTRGGDSSPQLVSIGFPVGSSGFGATSANQAGVFFCTTGSTGPWMFQDNLAAGITAYNLGATVTPSSYQTLRYEVIGNTATIEIDGLRVATVRRSAANTSTVTAGVFIQKDGGTTTRVWVDKIKLGIRRP